MSKELSKVFKSHLSLLLTRVRNILEIKGFLGGQGVNRTLDTRIFSPLLYRLSYLPTVNSGRIRRRCVQRTIIRILPLSPLQ